MKNEEKAAALATLIEQAEHHHYAMHLNYITSRAQLERLIAERKLVEGNS